MSVRSELVWWSRWWVRYFPGHLVRRLRHCTIRGHKGPLYDQVQCLCCGAPWFFGDRFLPLRTRRRTGK